MRNVPATGQNGGRRSEEWFERRDLDGFLHRSWLKSTGVTDQTFRGRPVIGICNSWSELVNCNVHLRGLAESVKRGVLQAGGFPLEFPVVSLGESLMKPTTMLYRNLMAMDVEESIRSYPLDGVVLLTGCDKTNPASILGAASADIPAIVVTGGPMLNGRWRGREIGSCSDCWHYHEELRAGRITEEEWVEIENSMSRSNGHCMTMGTASTMACVTEALGLTLPGGAAIPAVDSRRHHLAEDAGRQIVQLADSGLAPSDILTREAFENAIRVLHAISGSTNAILHLLAYAGRVGVELPLQLFDELCASTPWLVDLKPAGRYLMEDFFYAGGVPAVMGQIAELLHLDAITVTGQTVGENIAGAEIVNTDVIRTAADPLDAGGALVVLRGSLCPDGAVMKITAADPALLQHEGRALVFDGIHDLAARVDDPDLECDASSVMVLRNAGPIGGPGMPEWGHLPIPGEAPARRCDRSASHLGRAHERHVVRGDRPARGAGVGRRRTARTRARRRPDPARRVRAPARSPRRRAPSSSSAGRPGSRPPARTCAATGSCTPTTSCRPTKAATSTSSAARRPSCRTR